jgi:septal ring factor EnvC (AmiA/AmiB activator)
MRAALLLVSLFLAPAEPPEAVTYQPPVVAPVADRFRAPATPYGPGNRGLEYATVPGTPVRAAAAGTVAFAGQVGGHLHVTVAHADGVRTTYAFLGTIRARTGDAVAAGDAVGGAGRRTLWTARLGDVYLDPAALLAASGRSTVRLVPNRGSAATARPSLPVSEEAARWALG